MPNKRKAQDGSRSHNHHTSEDQQKPWSCEDNLRLTIALPIITQTTILYYNTAASHHGDLYSQRFVRLPHPTAFGAALKHFWIKIHVALPGYLTGSGRTGRSVLAWCDRIRFLLGLPPFPHPSDSSDHRVGRLQAACREQKPQLPRDCRCRRAPAIVNGVDDGTDRRPSESHGAEICRFESSKFRAPTASKHLTKIPAVWKRASYPIDTGHGQRWKPADSAV
ncbi:MAG: hypothetical protein LQ346_006366 [Caloplaca aetnensis]|nr:MAG: hypothetical protein LQ346_006366 [Caloplaca aetnensis]